MNTICIYTKNDRLSQRWRELLSKNNELKVCEDFEELKKIINDKSIVLFQSDADLQTIIIELDILHEVSLKKNILVLRSIPDLKEGEILLSHDIGGYGNANMSDDIFLQALEVIQSDSVWLYPELMENIIKKINKINTKSELLELKDLTQREKEVAILISKGESNQMIADDLSISQNTVKLHISSIFRKLDIKSRVALAILISKAS